VNRAENTPKTPSGAREEVSILEGGERDCAIRLPVWVLIKRGRPGGRDGESVTEITISRGTGE